MKATTDSFLRRMLAYRNKAEECRTMAEDFRDDGRKTVLESLGDDYDRMASQMEALVSSIPAEAYFPP